MGDEARMEGVPGLSAPVFLPCRSYAGRRLLQSVFAPLRVGAVTISNGGPAQPAIRRGEDNDGSYLSLRLGGAHGPAQCRKIHAVERPAGPESDHCHAQTPDHAQSDRGHSHRRGGPGHLYGYAGPDPGARPFEQNHDPGGLAEPRSGGRDHAHSGFPSLHPAPGISGPGSGPGGRSPGQRRAAHDRGGQQSGPVQR